MPLEHAVDTPYWNPTALEDAEKVKNVLPKREEAAGAGAVLAFSAAVVAPGSVLASRLRDLGAASPNVLGIGNPAGAWQTEKTVP